MKSLMKYCEWEALRLAHPTEFVDEYTKYMCDVDNVLNCQCCPAGYGEYRSCGQYVCWVSVHLNYIAKGGR